MAADEEHDRVDDSALVDIEATRARIPPDAYIKGMFFRSLVADLPDDHPWPTRRYAPLKRYDMLEYVDLIVAVARVQSGDAPITKGALRRIGHAAYDAMTSNAVGQMLVAGAGKHLDKLLGVVPRAYSLTVRPTQVRAERLGERLWRFRYRAAHVFLDSYQIGVLESVILAVGRTPDLRVRLDSEIDGDVFVSWK